MKTFYIGLTVIVCMVPATRALSFEHIFSAAADYYVPGASCACSGDFNGDGNIDLAVGHGTAVAVMIGLGHGTFGTAMDFSAGDTPFSICTGDFDKDGNIDLATANLVSNNISILLGGGDGSFAPPVNHTTGENPREICTGDFNEDGWTDLVVANYGYYDFPGMPGSPPGNISILLNNGNGTFARAINFSAGERIGGVTVSEFNGDGHLDLIISNRGYFTFPAQDRVSGSISLLVGAGDGTFTPSGTYDDGLDPYMTAAGDFNGDGRADLAVVNNYSDNVSVLAGSGTGLFVKLGDYAVGDGPNALCVCDVDADGHEDLAVTNEASHDVSILLGNGYLSFSPAVQYGIGEQPASVCSGDFDDDGYVDFAVPVPYSQAVSVMLGVGDGTLEAAPAYVVGSQPKDACTGDFNEDGHVDLAVSDYYSPKCSILLGSGDGAFAMAIQSWNCSMATSVCSEDFDEDGHDDLVFASGYLGLLTILFGYGNGTFVYPPVDMAITGEPNSVVADDFNHDGNMDLASAGSSVTVLLGLGDGTFEPAVYYGSGSYTANILIGDFNEDGHADIAVSRNNDYISILLNAGDGTFGSPVDYYACVSPGDIDAGDFNEDGHADLAVAIRADGSTPYTDNVSVLLGAGDGTFGSPAYFGLGHDVTSIRGDDFNGDGHVDLVVTNRNIASVSVLRGSGDGTFANVALYGVYRRPYSICIGDFNEDAKPDLAVPNVNSGNVSILINRAEPTVATLLHSFGCSHAAGGIAIDWRLSAVDASVDFSVRRESSGNGAFLPLAVEVARTGTLSYRCVDTSCEPGACYRYRVDVTDEKGTRTLFMSEQIEMPAAELALGQNYPNPFNPVTTIHYSIPARGHVTLDIFDAAGRRVDRLVDSKREAGVHSATWSGCNAAGRVVSSGVYFYRLTAGKMSISRKMVLLQ